jgi:hypothetical protein
MAILPENAKGIFVETIEKYKPNQWAEFLNKACGDDTQLRVPPRLVEKIML